jgi:hypothetical protein
MQMKLVVIINVSFYVTDQLLIIYSVFVKYSEKMGIKWSSVSATYKL